MNNFTIFSSFFQGKALLFLERVIDLALEEDGQDLTSNAVFSQESDAKAVILAKESCIVAGLPISELILARLPGNTETNFLVPEGFRVESGQRIMSIAGQTIKILKAERIILNLISRLSGIATLTDIYCQKLKGTGVRLLDTRKTSPGLRYPEKYAVLVGGGENHRLNLENMLMLKDNHIDQCGSITNAVSILRKTYFPCLDIEVECRTLEDVEEAVMAEVQRIMLDNMSIEQLKKSLSRIPPDIESEISGCITLDNIEKIAS
ncbi:MAG: carboxylating nicotinate-nucleotide diphosphorylase, partial [Desulfovibrionales bacterium]|nr:carboxylating nicotinate-nucleotide diphosphorylase [Desulfovibrionales bacterium]